MIFATLTAELTRVVAEASAEELPAVVGMLAQAQAQALARLTAGNGSTTTVEEDENLSAADAAHRLGVSKVYLYRHAARLPFAVRIGRRVLFSARGLERWNRQQRGAA